MKQLKHLKVGGSSYFIEGDSVIYAGNDGVKYVCGNQILQIYGYPEGLGSFTEPDFLKVGNKYVNRDRIIAYTNTGIALNTGTQYFETINYSNDNEYKNLCKYFDPTDSTAIDGWNIVKNKVCSFEPGSSNINGQIAEDIKPVTPTPPGPTPVVPVNITNIVLVPNVVTADGKYQLQISTDDYFNNHADEIERHLSVSIQGAGDVTRGGVSYGWTGTYVCEITVSDLRPYYADQYLSVYISSIGGGSELGREFPIQEPQSELVITSAGWDDDLGGFYVYTATEDEWTVELQQKLRTEASDKESIDFARIKRVQRYGGQYFVAELDSPGKITGNVDLLFNNQVIASNVF